MYIETIGWIASALLLISFFMKKMSDFRWYNLVGSFIYVLYGFLTGSMPVIVFNSVCTILNLYYLYYIYQLKEDYSVCLVDKKETYFRYFLNFYKNDISKLFPDFNETLMSEKTNSYIVMRNNQAIGVFILDKISEGELSVVLDYVIPSARNSKAGLFVHNKLLKELAKNKVQIVISKIINPVHRKYLERIGYTTSAVNARIIINLR